MTNFKLLLGAGTAALSLAVADAAAADDQQAPAATPPAPTPPPYPAMGATLSNNAGSASFDAGPLGKITVNGDISGLAYTQTNPGFDLDGHMNKDEGIDFSNAMVTIQKSDGVFQFVVEGGLYSFPALGTSYTSATHSSSDLFGPVPIGYVKIAPSSSFSFEVGQLPTLIGAEAPFTFQNLDIERGLLWNQEPLVSRGVQVNLSHGPLAASFAWTDGYYTGEYTSLSGNITYTFKNNDTLIFDGEGNLSGNFRTCSFGCLAPALGGTGGPLGLATPTGGQSQGQIYNLIFNHSSGKWAITPYAQYSYIPSTNVGGLILPRAQSWGAALLAKYSFTPEISLAGRAEYIGSSGGAPSFAGNILYGPGSSAWSLTITPTYQKGVFFARLEGSFTAIGAGTRGFELGGLGTASSQLRGLLEAGVVF
ncbi:MAG TPA: outer membrane beta-barrel protein [Caulobacteraceae bacterium]|jgi:hypothetical protein